MQANPVILGALILSVVASACSGGDGGGGGGGGELTTGVYLVTSSSESSDDCGVGPAVEANDTMNVTINGNTISIGSTVDGTIDGNEIDAPDDSPLDQQTTSGSDVCQAITRDDFSGTITGDDEFTLVEEYVRTVSNPGNWAGCPYTPCESRFTYEAQK